MSNSIPKINLENIRFETDDKVLIDALTQFVKEWNTSDKYFTVNTSGSTGKPKKINLSKEIALKSASNSVVYFGLDRFNTIGLCLSPNTIGGKMQLLRALISNKKTIVLPNKSNPLLDLNTAIDFITLVPFQVQTILEETPEKFELIQNVLVGGAKLSLELSKRLKDLTTQFYESYGMTETYSHVAIKSIHTNYFEALDGVSFSVDEDQLVIHAPFLNLPEIKTNDCVSLLSEKSFQLLGRSDFAINSGAYKFHPELLEQKLMRSLAFNFFIIGEKDERLGECVTFYIETSFDSDLKLKLTQIFEDKMSRFERPKKIYFCSNFIMTESGKVNRIATQKYMLEK
jgi:O-succinylbenzoic acid--CoA ligase